MLTISNSDCRNIIEILEAYGRLVQSSTNLREWNKGRQSRQLSKKLTKKLKPSAEAERSKSPVK